MAVHVPMADDVPMASDVPVTVTEAPLPGGLLVQVAEYAAAARAQTTQLAYGSDWEHFRRWCTEHGRNPLPATAETVAAYLAAFADALATNKLSRRRTVIRIAHAAAGTGVADRAPRGPRGVVGDPARATARPARPRPRCGPRTWPG